MKISAVIPAYNNAQYIADAVRSIQAQTHPVDEIIIIDDGSSDNTQQRIRELPGHINYIRQHNQGPSAARNTGIQAALGDWIAFLDADDQWTPGKIKKQLEVLTKFPELHLLAGDMQEINRQNQPVTNSVLAKHDLLQKFKMLDGQPINNALAFLISKNFIPTGTVLVKRTTLIEAGMFNHNIRFGEDLELWAKIAARHPISCLPTTLMLRRLHDTNATQNTALMLQDLIKVMKSIKHYAAATLKMQQQNPNQMVADAYADLGYWHFSEQNYSHSRKAFVASFKEFPSKRALMYVLSSLLPAGLINKIRHIKQRIAEKKRATHYIEK